MLSCMSIDAIAPAQQHRMISNDVMANYDRSTNELEKLKRKVKSLRQALMDIENKRSIEHDEYEMNLKSLQDKHNDDIAQMNGQHQIELAEMRGYRVQELNDLNSQLENAKNDLNVLNPLIVSLSQKVQQWEEDYKQMDDEYQFEMSFLKDQVKSMKSSMTSSSEMQHQEYILKQAELLERAQQAERHAHETMHLLQRNETELNKMENAFTEFKVITRIKQQEFDDLKEKLLIENEQLRSDNAYAATEIERLKESIRSISNQNRQLIEKLNKLNIESRNKSHTQEEDDQTLNRLELLGAALKKSESENEQYRKNMKELYRTKDDVERAVKLTLNENQLLNEAVHKLRNQIKLMENHGDYGVDPHHIDSVSSEKISIHPPSPMKNDEMSGLASGVSMYRRRLSQNTPSAPLSS